MLFGRRRLTMNSYAWIRGGEDSSGSDVNTDTSRSQRAAVSAATQCSSTGTGDVTSVDINTGDSATRGSRGHHKGKRRETRRHTLQNGLDYATVSHTLNTANISAGISILFYKKNRNSVNFIN